VAFSLASAAWTVQHDTVPDCRAIGTGVEIDLVVHFVAGAPMARALVIFGLVLVALGLMWPLFGKLGLGKLPGDIVIETPNVRIYIPLMTSIVISVVLSVVLWLADR
jgi:hypothetical protein